MATKKPAEPKKRKRRCSVDKAMEIYAAEGASAAAKAAGVHKRTVQRWAEDRGIKSGYDFAAHHTPCPSVAAFRRGCECDGCAEAMKEDRRQVKKRRVARAKRGQTEVKHGVSGYSNWDCRCKICKRSWSAYLRERRRPTIEV